MFIYISLFSHGKIAILEKMHTRHMHRHKQQNKFTFFIIKKHTVTRTLAEHLKLI